MKIVINIDEEDWKDINDIHFIREDLKFKIGKTIMKGKLLPEHHGRLIDADRLTRPEIMHLWYHLPNGDIACPKVDIDNAPTIIEAEGSESE